MKTENFLSEFFFSNYVGEYKFNTNKERELTIYAIEYISDCTKFEDTSSIMFDIFEKCSTRGYISIQTIPDDVWKYSIVNCRTFYYHPVLILFYQKHQHFYVLLLLVFLLLFLYG